MKKLIIATLIYVDEKGTLPPANTLDEAGNPLHSWRTLLLPYLGHGELYSKIRLDEPWDSEYNRQFHEIEIPVFRSPSRAAKVGETFCTVAIGDGFPFDPVTGKPFYEYPEPPILILELERPVNWMATGSEIVFETNAEGKAIIKGTNRPGQSDRRLYSVATADGSARFVSIPDADMDRLKEKLLGEEGGEK